MKEMKNFRLRMPAACLAATLVLVCAQAHASARQAGEKRRDGPIPGPVIKLPPGDYDPTTLAPEQEQRQQRATAARGARGQRWEYCVIYQVGLRKLDFASNYTGVAYIRHFRRGVEAIDGASEDEALANAMNKLGEEGWELVAIRESVGISDGNGMSTHSYFFKRPM